jgi:hypothetical protein
MQVNSGYAGERDLGTYDGQYAAAEFCKQCQSCGRFWGSSGTCAVTVYKLDGIEARAREYYNDSRLR